MGYSIWFNTNKYNQVMSQLQTTDELTTPRGRDIEEGLDVGVWYSPFIKNLAHYSSH